MIGNIFDTSAHYKATTQTNSNIGILTKYDTTIKTYSSLDKIQEQDPQILEKQSHLLALEGSEKPIITQVRKKLSSSCLQLTGHCGEVFSGKFSPNGDYYCSAGQDKQIYLWDVFNRCQNTGVLRGHTNAILDVHWNSDGKKILTGSADKSVCIWDAEEMKRIKKIKGHTALVTSVDYSRRCQELVVSGSDDCTAKMWDLRQRGVVTQYGDDYQVTAVCFNDTADKIFIGGIDNQIKVYDVRKQEIDYQLMGHTDTITYLSLSPDGNFLLSNSMDQTLRLWDIRPFVMGNRCQKIFTGHCHSFEKNLLKCGWSQDQLYVTAGSSDRHTYIWDAQTRKIVHKLGGHQGSVNETSFHPTEQIIASGSSDRSIIIGDIPEISL